MVDLNIRGVLAVLAKLVLVGVGVAAFVGVEYYLVMTRGVIVSAFYTMAFAAGFLLLIIAAYAIPLGKAGGEIVANLLWTMATFGAGTSAINMKPDGSYEFVATNEDEVDGEPQYWERFMGVRFGVTYDRCRAAFGEYAEDLAAKYDFSIATDGGTVALNDDATRGGNPQYVSLDEDPDSVFVAAGEKLSELEESASIDVGLQARSSAFVEYGGDTSEYSPWAMLVGSIVFLAMGLGFYVVV